MRPPTALPPDVLDRKDVRAALAEQDFGRLFFLIRKYAGISYNRIGEACDIKPSRVSELARGKGAITTLPKIEHIADVLRIPGRLLRLAPRPWERPGDLLPKPREELSLNSNGEAFAQAIRDVSHKLIVLDNTLNGLPIADLAARSFKVVHRRLGSGDYEARHERDIRASAAELAEVAGWALFNAGHFDASRRFNHEALLLAKLSGDLSIERLIMQNMAMLAGWVGRWREELAIAQGALDSTLGTRVEAMFRAREAQGLAGSAREWEVTRSFDRARDLLLESAPADTPDWAWWVTEAELDRQQGRVLQRLGHWHAAIPVLRRAMSETSTDQVGYRNVAAVRLLDCLMRVRAWREAQEQAMSLIPAVTETTSTVTLKILSNVCRNGEHMGDAPSTLRDTLRQVRLVIDDDPYRF
ncbi:XRE family transcriptional regulator [Streptomyces mayteni]